MELKDKLIEELNDKRVKETFISGDLWYFIRKQQAENLLEKFNITPRNIKL